MQIATNLLGAIVSFIDDRRLVQGVVRAVATLDHDFQLLVEVDGKLTQVYARGVSVVSNG